MASTADIKLHFEGVLEKAGRRFFEGFRKRWFILDGKDLNYYKAPEYTDENHLGTIDLSQVKSVIQTKVVSNGFQIITRTRTYTFSAPTPELLADWLSVLRQAMQLKSFQVRKNSRAEAADSEYEEVQTRSQRSASAASERSDGSSEEANLYESVGPSKKPPATNSSWGEYELIPEVVSSNQKRTPNEVGSRGDGLKGTTPSSNGTADAACGLVGAPTAHAGAGPAPAAPAAPAAPDLSSSEYDLIGPASKPVDSSANIQPVPAPQPDSSAATYATVKQRSASSKSLGARVGETAGGAVQYAQVRRPRSKSAPVEPEVDKSDSTSASIEAPPARYGSLKERVLSIISEDDQQESDSAADATPTPRPIIRNTAITEMKKFLETAEQGQTNSVEQAERSRADEEMMNVGNGSAFELLKQLLHRLDSQEAN